MELVSISGLHFLGHLVRSRIPAASRSPFRAEIPASKSCARIKGQKKHAQPSWRQISRIQKAFGWMGDDGGAAGAVAVTMWTSARRVSGIKPARFWWRPAEGGNIRGFDTVHARRILVQGVFFVWRWDKSLAKSVPLSTTGKEKPMFTVFLANHIVVNTKGDWVKTIKEKPLLFFEVVWMLLYCVSFFCKGAKERKRWQVKCHMWGVRQQPPKMATTTDDGWVDGPRSFPGANAWSETIKKSYRNI